VRRAGLHKKLANSSSERASSNDGELRIGKLFDETRSATRRDPSRVDPRYVSMFETRGFQKECVGSHFWRDMTISKTGNLRSAEFDQTGRPPYQCSDDAQSADCVWKRHKDKAHRR